MRKYFLLLLIVSTGITVKNFAQTSSYEQELNEWHSKRITSLKSENGWLNLAGLMWLQEGKNSFGSGDNVQIKFQIPQPVKFEQSFKDCYPVDFKKLNKDYPFSNSTTEYSIDFNGTSFVITGNIDKIDKTKEDIVQEIEVYLDGKLMEIAKLPTNYNIRKNDITWKYNLEKGIHNIRLKLKNSKEGYKINLWELLIYDNKPRQ